MSRSRSRRNGSVPILLLLMGLLATSSGCRPDAPRSPSGGAGEAPSVPRPTRVVRGEFPAWPLAAGSPLRPPAGTSPWRWRPAATVATGGGGRATLWVDRAWRWELEPSPPPGLAALVLEPDDPDRWHSLTVTWPDTAPPVAWTPLARRPVRSPHHADLLDLLARLVPARDGRPVVVHWPAYPVTVGGGPAVAGSVDLAACLRDGVTWWGRHLPGLFTWRGTPDSAVRLIHIPGHELHPPLSIHVLRRDERGRPLRMTIRVGDTYHTPHQERHARRGLLHELTHAAGLWYHSPDRRHILWRAGPIVDVPDTDEVLTIRWLLSLPEGLDLRRYGRRGELDPEWDAASAHSPRSRRAPR